MRGEIALAAPGARKTTVFAQCFFFCGQSMRSPSEREMRRSYPRHRETKDLDLAPQEQGVIGARERKGSSATSAASSLGGGYLFRRCVGRLHLSVAALSAALSVLSLSLSLSLSVLVLALSVLAVLALSAGRSVVGRNEEPGQ